MKVGRGTARVSETVDAVCLRQMQSSLSMYCHSSLKIEQTK